MILKFFGKMTGKRFLLKFEMIFLSSILLVLTSCNPFGQKASDAGDFSVSADDTERAVKLVDDANNNLKRIKILYTENNEKFEEFKIALEKKDIEKVKKLANELQYAINDGYVLAESAKEDIAGAQELNINQKFREYLQLKEASLEMQIKAFDFRRESAKLFRDKFGTEDELQLKTAQETFKQNEERFAKHMKDAADLSRQADALAKEVLNKKTD